LDATQNRPQNTMQSAIPPNMDTKVHNS